MVHIFRFHGLAPAQFVLSCAEHEDALIAANALDEDYPGTYHAIIPDSWLNTKGDDDE